MALVHPTDFAREVARGDRPASLPVRDACARHLADWDAMEAGSAGFDWQEAYLRRFEHFLRWINVDVDGERVPMTLLPWQRFVMGSILCWIMGEGDQLGRAPGTRRFRHALIMTPKSAGKSPLLAALALYMLEADGFQCPRRGRWIAEDRPRCFALASSVQQASGVVMAPLAAAIEERPELAARYRLHGGAHPTLIISERGGRFQALGQHNQGLAGAIVHLVIGEEPHEWRNTIALDALVAGFKRRLQPLCLIATNAPVRHVGVAHEMRLSGLAAARGDGGDSEFAFISEVPEDCPRARDHRGKALWYPAEEYWPVANPSFGTSICPEGYLLDAIARADSESQRAGVRRLNFGEVPGSLESLVTMEQWRLAEGTEDDWTARADGAPDRYVGIDLAPRTDMSAIAVLDVPPSGPWRATVEYVLPRDSLEDRDARTDAYLTDWSAKGHIHAWPGGSVSFAELAQFLAGVVNGGPQNVLVCADPHELNEFCAASEMTDHPFRVYRAPHQPGWSRSDIHIFPQGHWPRKMKPDGSILWMEHGIAELKTRIMDGEIVIEPNPVLRWNLECARVARNQSGNRRLHRPEDRRRADSIDGIQALCMAAGLAKWRLETAPKSFYGGGQSIYAGAYGATGDQWFDE